MPSSVVRKYHYDPDTKTLRINYVSGMIYDYLNVPEEVYLEMKNAFSKGTFLNEKIKKNYDFKKINEVVPK